jgi:hypothetical protein
VIAYKKWKRANARTEKSNKFLLQYSQGSSVRIVEARLTTQENLIVVAIDLNGSW